MKPAFFVSEFEKDNFVLSNLIKESLGVRFQDVTQKRQLRTIIELLSELEARTIVCETDYTDNGYLDDYKKYYVGCHENYPKRCVRLHFFKKVFDYQTFHNTIESCDTQKVKNDLGDYLGFIVIKPIPMTFLGRTCLCVPSSYKGELSKIIVRPYQVDLFGISLEVDSLAYQEQDQVVSACASASIWCLLHALGKNKVPSPSEITLAATEHNKVINTFPNDGLTPEEIDRAIEYFGFRKHTLNPKADKESVFDIFSKHVRAYVDSKTPLLLGATVYRNNEKNNKYFEVGDHAVTIIGYKENEQGCITKLYVHDDRQGPFTILNVENEYSKNIKSLCDKPPRFELVPNLSRKIGDKQFPDEILVINNLLVATDERVRLNCRYIYKTSEEIVDALNIKFKDMAQLSLDPKSSAYRDMESLQYSYSVKLYKSSDLKRKVKRSQSIINKVDLLTNNLPKYVWSGKIFFEGDLKVELIFDATSLPQGEAYICSVIYDKNVNDFIGLTSKELYKKLLQERGEFLHRDYGFTLQVTRRYSEEINTYFKYLNETFGPARPPKRIKNEEFSDQLLNQQDDKLVFYNSLDNPERLIELFDKTPFDKDGNKKLIWVISRYGAIFIGRDSQQSGHPTLTGANPARIGGELVMGKSGKIVLVNPFSGRYASNYNIDEKMRYLENAIVKLQDVLRNTKLVVKMADFEPM